MGIGWWVDFLIIMSTPGKGFSRLRLGLARARSLTIVKQTKLESVETTPFLQSVTVHDFRRYIGESPGNWICHWPAKS